MSTTNPAKAQMSLDRVVFLPKPNIVNVSDRLRL